MLRAQRDDNSRLSSRCWKNRSQITLGQTTPKRKNGSGNISSQNFESSLHCKTLFLLWRQGKLDQRNCNIRKKGYRKVISVVLKLYFQLLQDFVYIILELCRRRSLMELHKRRKAITEPETRYFMKQILLGVKYLHDNKIIHRDLKLGNIFLNDNMEVSSTEKISFHFYTIECNSDWTR